MNGTDQRRARQLAAIRDSWIAAGLSIARANRPQASAAIEILYREAGLERPVVHWFASPLAAVRALLSHRFSGRLRCIGSLDVRRRTSPVSEWFAATDWAEATRIRDAVAARVWREVGQLVERHVLATAQTEAPQTEAPQSKAWMQAAPPLASLSAFALSGQHDAASMALYQVLTDVQRLTARNPALDAMADLARAAGPAIPLDGHCLVAERPCELHLDEQGRLHAAGAPAVLYPDGMAVYAWHGVDIGPQVALEPQLVTADRIDGEENPHLRRTLMDIHGLARYLDARARIVHQDETGRLWARTFPTGGTWMLVEVENGTPEPDGTRRHYYLRVPPTMRTACEAVAWTYGLRADQYHPMVRT